MVVCSGVSQSAVDVWMVGRVSSCRWLSAGLSEPTTGWPGWPETSLQTGKWLFTCLPVCSPPVYLTDYLSVSLSVYSPCCVSSIRTWLCSMWRGWWRPGWRAESSRWAELSGWLTTPERSTTSSARGWDMCTCFQFPDVLSHVIWAECQELQYQCLLFVVSPGLLRVRVAWGDPLQPGWDPPSAGSWKCSAGDGQRSQTIPWPQVQRAGGGAHYYYITEWDRCLYRCFII